MLTCEPMKWDPLSKRGQFSKTLKLWASPLACKAGTWSLELETCLIFIFYFHSSPPAPTLATREFKSQPGGRAFWRKKTVIRLIWRLLPKLPAEKFLVDQTSLPEGSWVNIYFCGLLRKESSWSRFLNLWIDIDIWCCETPTWIS